MEIIKQNCNGKNIGFFIGGDFNGKNINWGSSTSGDRGRYIIDWLVDSDFDFINDGTFTYMNSTSNKEDVLDLSLISMKFLNLVTNWEVKKDIYYILKDKNRNKQKKNDHNFLQHQQDQPNNRINISDHYTMVTKLHFDPICNETPSNLTWNFQTNKIQEVKNVVSQYMEEWKTSYDLHWHDRNYVDSLAELFQLLIFKAGYNVFGLKKYCKNMINAVSIKTKRLMEEKHKISNKLSNLLKRIKKRYHGRISKTQKKRKTKLRKEIKKLNKKTNNSKSNKVRGEAKTTSSFFFWGGQR